MLTEAKALIKYLKNTTGIGIRCPCCDGITPTKRADLFVEGEFSKRAIQFRDGMIATIADLKSSLREFRTGKPARSARAAKTINVGKTLERFAPILNGFKCSSEDCRALFEPIDFIVFHGLRNGAITNIEFLDIKSGRARLTESQSSVRDAINSGKVSFHYIEGKR